MSKSGPALRDKRWYRRSGWQYAIATVLVLLLVAGWWVLQIPKVVVDPPKGTAVNPIVVHAQPAAPALPPPAAPMAIEPPKASRDRPSAKAEMKAAGSRPASAKSAQMRAAQATPIAQKPEIWNHWNAAPYATSQGEACRKAPEAIDGFISMPQAVKDHFKRAVGSACKGESAKVWLTPHQRLEEMWSGPDKHHKAAHVMKLPEVAEHPVVRAADGRTYRPGSVAESPSAEVWTYVYEGKTYVLYLPHVCFNWSWTFGPPVIPLKNPCYTISFNAPPGKVRWGVGVKEAPLPPDECNAIKQGDKPWTAWYGDCNDFIYIEGRAVPCIPPVDYIQRVLGASAFIPHRYVYVPMAKRQTLRFSGAVLQAMVYICLEDREERRSCRVDVRPEDWKGRTHIDVPDSLWVWDRNCPQ
jgi:hypothetical protein